MIRRSSVYDTRDTVIAALIANGYDKDNMQVYHLRSEDVMVIAPLYTPNRCFRCSGIAPDRTTIMFRDIQDDDADQPTYIEYRLSDLSAPPLPRTA